MKFAHPWILYATPVLTGLFWLLLHLSARRRAALVRQFTGGTNRPWADSGARPGLRRLDNCLLLFTCASLLLALARPLVYRQDEKSELQGVPYLIALDTSRSMLTPDVRPNRWTVATNGLDRFLAEAGNDRVGLISFAGVAYLNAPLSFDMNAIRTTLRYLDPELMNDGGSSLASAVERAGRYFVSNNIPQRVVILVTDGEDLEGNLIPTARRWARQGLKICAIGVGTPMGAKVPMNRFNPGGGSARNTFGQEVVSKLDESNLQRLAAASGGRYYRLGDRGEGFRKLRGEFLRPLAEAAAREDLQNYREWYQVPLVAAFAALVAHVLLAAHRARRAIRFPAIGAHLQSSPP